MLIKVRGLGLVMIACLLVAGCGGSGADDAETETTDAAPSSTGDDDAPAYEATISGLGFVRASFEA